MSNSIIFKYQNPLDVNYKEGNMNLCVSVFYNKLNWHTLILEGIVPFLEKTNCKLFFYLNKSRGAHIRLVIITSEKEARYMAKQIDDHLKDFLNKKPSERVIDKEQEQDLSLFMDFKNNSVQYGLFDSFFDTSMLQFYIGLSELLIFTFKEYGESFHSELNGILLQCITIFCNAMEVKDKEMLAIFKSILNEEYLKYSEEELLIIKETNQQDFEDNSEVLIEYLKDYRFRKHYEEAWETDWHNFSIKVFSNILELDSDQQKPRIAYAINKMLEVFNVSNRISIYYLLSEGIEKYNLD